MSFTQKWLFTFIEVGRRPNLITTWLCNIWSLPEPIVHNGVAFVWKIVRRTTLTFGEKLDQFFLSDRFSETCCSTQPGHMVRSPDDSHVLVPVWPQVGVVSPQHMEQLVEDEAGVRGEATQRWPQLQVNSLTPARVVWGHLELLSDKTSLSFSRALVKFTLPLFLGGHKTPVNVRIWFDLSEVMGW